MYVKELNLTIPLVVLKYAKYSGEPPGKNFADETALFYTLFTKVIVLFVVL